MRALNRLINRFEWAVKNKKPIHPNVEDLESLNQLSEYISEQKINSNLEDSLLLFWVMCYWRLELEENRLKFKSEPKGFIELSDVSRVIDRLCGVLKPKNVVIDEITLDIQLTQRAVKTPAEKIITREIVDETLTEALTHIKNRFTPISQLHRFHKVVYDYGELTDAQREMLGI